MSSPQASVVIPTFNAGPGFKELLRRLSFQSTDFDYEVIVIDSGSTDGTLNLAREYGAAVYRILPGEFDHGGTRNLGISRAAGEYVALTVQDAVPLDECWLSAMVENLERDELVAGVYGRQVPRPDSDELTRMLVNTWATASPARREQFAGGPERYRTLPAAERRMVAMFDNVNSCLRRSVWERFPFPRTSFGEDLRWGKVIVEAGYKLVYEPRSAVYHSHERSAGYDLRRHYVDQLVVLDLFGWELAPKPWLFPLDALRTTASLWRRLRRARKPDRVPASVAFAVAKYAAVARAGACLAVGGRRLSRHAPGPAARLDRLLKRGI